MQQFAQQEPDPSPDELSKLNGPQHIDLHALTKELVFNPSIVRSINLVIYALARQLEAQITTAMLSTEEFAKALDDPSTQKTGCQHGDLEILPSRGNAYFFSDCEGSYRSLIRFLINNKIIEKLELASTTDPVHLVFLGDSIDRSVTSLPFMELLFKLKMQFPDQIHIMSGNHELSSAGQMSREGFYLEIQNAKLSVGIEEWRELRRMPFFLEYFRGAESSDGLVWASSAAKRAMLCQQYIRAFHNGRTMLDKETTNLGIHIHREGSEKEKDFSSGLSDHQVEIRNIREKIAKTFLWDLYQVFFSGQAKTLVSNNIFASHGLMPTTGVFDSENLSSKKSSVTELLLNLSRTYQLPEEERLERIEDIVWSDLDLTKPEDNLPRVEFNDTRDAGKIVNQAAVEQFLSAVGRKIFIRGHQILGVGGYEMSGPIHTIQSSARGGGSCLRVSLDANQSAPEIERFDFIDLSKGLVVDEDSQE
jgi:hypothetical protein